MRQTNRSTEGERSLLGILLVSKMDMFGRASATIRNSSTRGQLREASDEPAVAVALADGICACAVSTSVLLLDTCVTQNSELRTQVLVAGDATKRCKKDQTGYILTITSAIYR